MASLQITSVLVLPLAVIVGCILSPSTANPLMNTWSADSIENLIPPAIGREIKNDDDFLMSKEHRRIKKEMAASLYNKREQMDDRASVIGDSRKRRSEIGLNQDSEAVAEAMKNTSKTEGAEDSNAKALIGKESVSETEFLPDLQDGDGDDAFITEPNIFVSRSAQSAQTPNELDMPDPKLSTKKGTSVGKAAKLSEDPPPIIDYNKSEYPSKIMTGDAKMTNPESSGLSEPWNSSLIPEGIDIPQTDDESHRMPKVRRVEGTDTTFSLMPGRNIFGLHGVENEDPLSEVYGSNLNSIKGTPAVVNMGLETRLLSDKDNRQAVEDKVTEHMADMEWNNYNLRKNENSTTIPSHDIEAYFRQFSPFVNSQVSGSWQNSQEKRAPLSLENFNNGLEPRYVVQDQPVSYYYQNAAEADYLKDAWNSGNQMCAVPCWRTNYVVQPYAYGIYVPGSDQNYVNSVQVPQVTLPPSYLPPMQFPDTHSGATAFSSVSVGGHGGQANANQHAHEQNYAVTSNAYGGSSQGSHSYGGSSHSFVKEPLNHLEYSLTTPQKILHTSLIVKAPLIPGVHPLHPYQYVQPHVHVAEQKNINVHKSTVF